MASQLGKSLVVRTVSDVASSIGQTAAQAVARWCTEAVGDPAQLYP